MRRGPYGRDLGLTLRMAIALVPIALWYVVAGLFSAFFLAVGVHALLSDGSFGAFLGSLLFGVGYPVMVWAHMRKTEKLVLRTARAKLVEPGEERELQELLIRVAAHADLRKPRLALIGSRHANAFSVGRSPSRTVVALTTELVRRLTPEELEAVVAHELAHVANRDGLVMTVASAPAMVGSFLWSMDDERGKVLFAFYFPVYAVGLLLMWAISRYREYAADQGSALVTGAPEQLMSALAKIDGKTPRGDLRGGAAVSALCIVPLPREGRLRSLARFELLADHPPLEKRLERLEEIARELGRPQPM